MAVTSTSVGSNISAYAYAITKDGDAELEETFTTANFTVSSADVTSEYGVGTFNIELVVTGGGGLQNTETGDNDFTMITMTKAAADAASSITAYWNASTLGTPTTADNCSVFSTTNNAPASFPLGPTTVTWTRSQPELLTISLCARFFAMIPYSLRAL